MVRRANPEDAPVIAGMLHDFNEEFEEPTPGPGVLEPRVRRFIEEDTKMYLLVGDDPFGFAQMDFIASIWADEPVGHLDELYVRPGRRGKGAGRELMNAILADARRRGVAGLEVVTGEDDTAARGLYESAGFVNEIEGADNSRSLFYELTF
ncbi:MAG TPA: GNAT family N-acetyltransferase [Solirubrobacterales bacterium]|nr:GNAT family N-acetyltransferase [Solirubrobacterales bacterium]